MVTAELQLLTYYSLSCPLFPSSSKLLLRVRILSRTGCYMALGVAMKKGIGQNLAPPISCIGVLFKEAPQFPCVYVEYGFLLIPLCCSVLCLTPYCF